jgi:DNA-binding HxlR family transcriptional regulator
METSGLRAGSFALSLLAAPPNVHILQALQDEPLSLYDLRKAVGAPPQTTLRGNLRTLGEQGLVDRRLQNSFPGSVEYELSRSGIDLLEVSQVVEDWLQKAPEQALELGTSAAKNAIRALVEGWSTGIVRALAARPLCLTEISELIVGVSYPSLERRLTVMRLASQLETRSSSGRGKPYVVTDWLRHALGPLAAGTRWERAHAPTGASALGKIDVEAGFFLALPLLKLSDDLSGSCRLAVELGRVDGELRLAGTQAVIKEGQLVSCGSRLGGRVDGWVSGSSSAWLRALLEGHTDELELGGDCDLASHLVEGVHFALSPAPQPT